MEKKDEHILFLVAPILGSLYGTYKACELFRYTNDTPMNRLFYAIIMPFSYAIILVFVSVLIGAFLKAYANNYSPKFILLAVLIVCTLISVLYSRGKSKYISTEKAINAAYEAGYNDGIECEYNDCYFTDVFEEDYYYRGGY